MDLGEADTPIDSIPTMARGFKHVVESSSIVPTKTRLVRINPIAIESPEESDDEFLFDCSVPNIPVVSIVKERVSFARSG
jgi:hypothetical protein